MSLRDLMDRRLLLPLCFAGLTASASSGCEIVLIIAATADDDDYECYDACDCYGECGTDEPPPTENPSPPTVTISIADWPPAGPGTQIHVDAVANGGSLVGATWFFRNKVTTEFDGATAGSTWINGEALGEGFGTLTIDVETNVDTGTRREVQDFLVDLSEPTAYADDTVLPAAGAELNFWIADAWVVSGYYLSIGGKTFEAELEPGYPSTLGVEWDYSLVSIPVSEIPVGVHEGLLVVHDAAGNEAVLDLPVTIDGTPPTATIESPAEGATFTGPFQIDLGGTDDLPGAVSLELRLGGALVATAIGPSATVVVDPAEFPEGALEISVLAVDEAGNKSAPALRTVQIARP